MATVLAVALVIVSLGRGSAAAVAPPPPVTEYPVTLNPDWKGRTVAVAVSPVDDNVAFIASDNGGLFKTTDQGASWSHVESFPAHDMSRGDIAFFPDAANILIASGNADSQTINGGGIWRSVDGGATWQKPATSDSPDAGCTADRNAFGIGITTGGNVYVGTACGVAISHDFGATWTHTDPTPGGSRQVNDVVAQPGGIVDICAQDGHHRSINFGGAWTAPTPGSPACNSIAVSPFETDVLFVSSDGGILWEGDPDGSGGFTWTQLFAPTPNNRPPFVKTHPATDGDANHFDLFFGDGELTYRQHCVNTGGPGLRCPVQAENDPANDCPAGSTADCGTAAACTNAVDDDGDQIINEGCPANGDAETTGLKESDPQCNDHDDDDSDGFVNDGCPVMLPYGTEFHSWFDHTDIGFETSSPTGCPILFTGDGGIAKSTDCGATWPNASNGLAALQVYEVTGTVHEGTHTDVYFSTQDNLIWASPDNGVTWPKKVYWEGFFLQTPLSASGDYEMTGVTCGPCYSFRRTQHFDSDLGWPSPPGGGGWPFLIEPGPSGSPTQPGRYAQVSQSTLYISEPETGAECANAVDDDADNVVNDGCPSDGSPETGAQCHDAIDNDDGGSGPVNEGCSSLNSAETGGECSNSADDDNDGVVNDGCPKVGSKGESGAQCMDAIDANEDGAADAVNDGCPEIGVYAPTGPAVPSLRYSRLYVVGPPNAPTIYILTNKGATTGISKIAAISNGTAVISAADSGLIDVGAQGRGRIGIDPNDAQHLIVPDIGAGKMMVSTDGGATWTPDLQLTALVTDNGRLKFSYAGGGPQARSIMFDPADGDRILVGTEDGGIIATLDGGEHWFHVEGSDEIPTITSFFFDAFNDIVWVSSYGRGLWQLAFPETDLSVTKTDSPDPVMAGEELFYTITATNNGPNPATVEVLDTLPQEVTYIGNDLATPLGCVEFAPGSLRCDVGALDVGESITFVVKVRVKSSAAVATPSGSTSIVNTATVQSTDTVDSDTSNNTATAVTFAEELSDLKVTKICKPDGQLLAGETATCTIFVDNLGPSDARNVQLTDTILSDGSFTIGTITASQGSCDPPSGGVVTCDLGDLEAASPSVSGRATVAIDVTATEAMDINDVATVVSDTPDPDTTNNQAQGSVSVTAVADLQLCKADSPGASLCTTTASSSAGPDPVVAGNSLRYELEVVNTGPSTASNVVVEDVLPSSVTIDSVSAAGGSCNAGVPGDPLLPTTCTFDSLLPGQSSTMIVVVTVKPDTLGIIHNDARVSSDTFDDDNSNDLASEDTTVDAQADLSITKADLPDPVIAGTTLTYELTVVNSGPSDAVGVVVEDALPEEVTFQSATISNGSGTCVLFNEPPNTVSCQLDTVAPNAGSPILIYIDVLVRPDVADGSSIDNAATVNSSTSDPNSGNDSATTSTTVNAEADLEIQKDGNFEAGNPSTTIIYTITVINHGPSDAQDVAVVDTLPQPQKKVIFVFETSNGACTYVETTHTVECDFGTLAAGASISFNIHIQTKGNLGTITNIAEVSSSTTDPDSSNNTARKDMLVQGGSGKTGGPGGGRGKGNGPAGSSTVLEP